MDISGKRIIVSGAARGMGEATVNTYVAAGARVVAMDVADEAGEAVVEAANRNGPGEASYLHVDVADRDSVETAFGQAAEWLGGLDVLAHPAAIHQTRSATDVTPEEWNQIFAINVKGTMLTNQAAYPHLKASGGGSIINFGSISGQRPEPSAAAYSASKGAVHSWTRTAAATWGVDGIRVNAILPAIATPMYREAMERASEEQRAAAYWINRRTIWLGEEYGDAERDLGPVMVFLASDASHFITGQLIPVDGGQTNVR